MKLQGLTAELKPDVKIIREYFRCTRDGENTDTAAEARVRFRDGRMVSRLFSEPEEGVEQVLSAYEQYPDAVIGAYATINPISREKLGSRSFAKDRDVANIKYIPIDIDPIKAVPDASATDAEKASAKELCDRLITYLEHQGFAEPDLLIDSGNGFHIYYRVEDCSADLVKKLLSRLSGFMTTSRAKVDKAVSNPSRIMRIPGTYACKGENTTERPWRLSRILKGGEL